jgi:predicted DNA-binding transcriptional regulator YafY
MGGPYVMWELAEEEVFVSKRTVQRDQRALGGRHLTCERVQRLSDLQKTKRMAFAKTLDKNWEKFFLLRYVKKFILASR